MPQVWRRVKDHDTFRGKLLMDEILRSSNRRRCRISVVTSAEQRWLDALTDSPQGKDLLKGHFTASQACQVIATVPTKKGTTRRNIPRNVKLCFVFRKSKVFIVDNQTNKGATQWLYVGRKS